MHRRKWFFAFASATSSAVIALVACSGDEPSNRLPVTDDDGGKRRRDGEVADGADPPLPDGTKPPGRVYATTQDNLLYRYDPLDGSLTKVGVMGCVPRTGVGEPGSSLDNDVVIDIALNRAGEMYGTTFWRFIRIDPVDGSCQVIKTETDIALYPNSLSFVPMGTVDPSADALVGYGFSPVNSNATVYTRILLDGSRVVIGDINPKPPLGGISYRISGDFISLSRSGGTTFGSVTQLQADGGPTPTNDQLVEIDPKSGSVTRVIGSIGQSGLFGMGFWAGTAYGFASAGNIFEIDVTTGKSKLALQAQGDGGPLVWYGAGVTTDSPTAP